MWGGGGGAGGREVERGGEENGDGRTQHAGLERDREMGRDILPQRERGVGEEMRMREG